MIIMEISKKRTMDEILCTLARGNCITILKTRPLLSKDAIVQTCQYVSSICKLVTDDKCQEQSDLCAQAAYELRHGHEKRYLALCKKATETCPYNFNSKVIKLSQEFMENLKLQRKNQETKTQFL